MQRTFPLTMNTVNLIEWIFQICPRTASMSYRLSSVNCINSPSFLSIPTFFGVCRLTSPSSHFSISPIWICQRIKSRWFLKHCVSCRSFKCWSCHTIDYVLSPKNSVECLHYLTSMSVAMKSHFCPRRSSTLPHWSISISDETFSLNFQQIWIDWPV